MADFRFFAIEIFIVHKSWEIILCHSFIKNEKNRESYALLKKYLIIYKLVIWNFEKLVIG